MTKTVNYPAAAPTRPTQDLHGRKRGARQHKDPPTERLPFPNRGHVPDLGWVPQKTKPTRYTSFRTGKLGTKVTQVLLNT